MALVPIARFYRRRKRQLCCRAFNAFMEKVQAIMEAAQNTGHHAGQSHAIKYAGLEFISAMVKVASGEWGAGSPASGSRHQF